MADELYGFGEKDADEILDARDFVRSYLPQPPAQIGRRISRAPHQKLLQWIRISSTTLVNGFYPGFWSQYDPGAGTWTDKAAIYALGPNGETLAATRYLARIEGQYSDGTPIYIVTAPVGATSGKNGTGIKGGGTQTWAAGVTANFKFDGGLESGWSATSGDTYTLSGTGNVNILPSAAGFRLVGCYLNFTPAAGITGPVEVTINGAPKSVGGATIIAAQAYWVNNTVPEFFICCCGLWSEEDNTTPYTVSVWNGTGGLISSHASRFWIEKINGNT